MKESEYDAPIVKTGTTDPNAWRDYFTEGLMVDYRHFDKENIEPLYGFGFGFGFKYLTLQGWLKGI